MKLSGYSTFDEMSFRLWDSYYSRCYLEISDFTTLLSTSASNLSIEFSNIIDSIKRTMIHSLKLKSCVIKSALNPPVAHVSDVSVFRDCLRTIGIEPDHLEMLCCFEEIDIIELLNIVMHDDVQKFFSLLFK